MEIALKIDSANGESPTWSEPEQALYWIDIKNPALHRFDPRTGQDRVWPMPCEIGAFALRELGGAIVALRNGLFAFDLKTEALSQVALPPYNPATHRFNDGKCDSHGRFWIGAMQEAPLGAPPQITVTPAPLSVLGRDMQLRVVPGISVVIGNGLAFSLDDRQLYFAHTEMRTVFRYPFDPDAGRLGERETYVHFAEGRPDGAAMDAEGFYWCALWGGGKIARVAPDGSIDREVVVPVSQPSMCAFGGDDLKTLYITTARHGLDDAALRKEPLAGSLFSFRPGVQGLPTYRFGG